MTAPGSRPAGRFPYTALGVGLLCNLAVLLIYVWFVSVGTWTDWPTLTTFYDQQASGYLRGSLALLTPPDPAMVALPDPYDPSTRGPIPYTMDFSLYQGKYYLYFGPVPALILLVAKLFVPAVLGDQFLALPFTFGVFLFESLIVIRAWRRFFSEVPAWAVGCILLVLGLTLPFTWVLGLPTVYTAAIMGGQMFFMAGLFAAFAALDRASISRVGLALAAACWAAAVGCRITQIVPVMLMALLVLLKVLGPRRLRPIAARRAATTLFVFVLPLAVGAAGLFWYNWVRFGSIFETGIKYQLTGVPLRQYGASIYSPVFVIQNLYGYLLNPPVIRPSFPWLRPAGVPTQSMVPFVQLPDMYRGQQMTGLLYSAPFVILALVPAFKFAWGPKDASEPAVDLGSLRWLTTALAAAFVSSFALFLIFFWATERYFGDFLPSLLVLSVIGGWQLTARLGTRSTAAWLGLLFAATLILASVLVSTLLAISINSDGFRQLNPVLWRELSNLFRP